MAIAPVEWPMKKTGRVAARAAAAIAAGVIAPSSSFAVDNFARQRVNQ